MPDSSAQLPASMISSRRHSAADGFIYPSPETSAPCTRAASAAHNAAECIPFFSKGSDVSDGARASVPRPEADQATTPDLPRKALQVLLEISGCVHPACASLGPAAGCIAGYVPGTMLPPRTSGETFILPRQKLQPCRGFLEQQVAGMPIQDVQKPWFMYAGHR